jgi:hypothetical protein
MKGLTPLEVEALRRAVPCSTGDRAQLSDSDRAVYNELLANGRVQVVSCPCHGVPIIITTTAGHEALSLWAQLKRFFTRGDQ